MSSRSGAGGTAAVRQALAHAKGYMVNRSATWSAVRSARRACRGRSRSVRICWDLDNTLVDSGSLLGAGMVLDRAVVEAKPLPNMLAFFDAVAKAFPTAEHFVLTARLRGMRIDTLGWLARHGLTMGSDMVLLVPFPDDKRRVWRALARNGDLVIIDDLSFGHESGESVARAELVEFARRTASVYVGVDEIARVANGDLLPETLAGRIAERVPARADQGGEP